MAVERFPVEEGSIMLFARAIGDPNPIYFDPDHAARSDVGGLIAPPTYLQSSAQWDPEYPLRPRIGEPWFGSGRTPSGTRRSPDEVNGEDSSDAQGTTLHAEQHFEYHRPVRPGDVLSMTTGPPRRWEKQGRSGKLVFSELVNEYRNQAGELVVTARMVGVLTEGAPSSGPTDANAAGGN